MQRMTANEAKTQFGAFIDMAQREPVTKVSSWVAIPPETALRKFSRDPDDDKFSHTAMAGQARVLVSGDRDLLDLKIVDGIEIITPARAHARWLG